MEASERDILAASPDPDEALNKPLKLDENELAEARQDERWAEFARQSEEYVRHTTREASEAAREQYA